ncbi:MAG: OmpH family outer membrane protein [Rhodothermales bacterium]
MRTTFLSAFFLFTVAFSPATTSQQAAQAQTLKVGYTDHEVIIANMPAYVQIQGRLQAEYQGGQEALQSLAADFQSEVEKYQKQQPLLSAEKRAERENELAARQKEIQDAAGRKDQELGQLEADLMQPILKQVQDAIDAVAKEKSLDLVLRYQIGGGQPVLLYANPDRVVDITLDVAKRLGIDVSEAEAANASN